MSAPRFAAVLALALAAPAGLRAADLDPYLPADTESYVSLNVRQMLESPIIKKVALGPLRNALKDANDVNDILKDLGFDPFKHLDRVTVASPTSTDTDRGLIIVQGTFDERKFRAKAADAAQNNSEALTIHKVPLGGGVTHEVYEVAVPGQDLSLFVALATNKVLLASPGKDYVVDALKQVRQKKQPALKNKAFQALLEKMDPRQSLSLAVLGKSLAGAASLGILPKAARDSLANLEAIGGGLTVGKEIKLDVAVSSKDERNARRTREVLDKGVKLALVGLALLGEERKELGLLLEVMKTVKVTGKARVVALSARLTADVLEDFFKKDD
jgi:hypothetical protein